MRLCKFFFVGCLSLVSLASHAETLNGLYQVLEPVGSQSPQERDQATQRALQTMVIRLTGDAKAAEGPGLAAIRKDPQQIITQYGYDAGPPESLQVDFDPVSTDRALRDAGLSIWGSNRPSILGWWLNDSTEGSVQGADTGAVADAVMLAISQKLAPRFAVKPGVSTEQLLEVQGMTLERYAALGHLLEPLGGQPLRVEGDRIVYRVNGSADQLRTQLSLARLQEIPAGEPAPQPVAAGTQPPAAPEPQAQLRFRW